jgi:hypothetical protein
MIVDLDRPPSHRLSICRAGVTIDLFADIPRRTASNRRASLIGDRSRDDRRAGSAYMRSV